MSDHIHLVVKCLYCHDAIAQCCVGETLTEYRVRFDTCGTCIKKIGFLLKRLPDEVFTPKPEKKSCCEVRKKVVVAIAKVLSEEECGVNDSALVDVLDHTKNSAGGKPILAFQFCPWCGTRRDLEGDTRVTEEVSDG